MWNPGGNNNYESYGEYKIPKGSDFKKYKIGSSNHSDDFGTKDVLTVSNSSGNERFYVMALDDVDSNSHYWYYMAKVIGSPTSTNFGSGKQNTKNMISKWNDSEYGSQFNNGDMWGISAVRSKINENPSWYVPSKAEWSAFGESLGITTSNYKNKYLSDRYWSSSCATPSTAWLALFDNGCMFNGEVYNSHYVRLGTTF